MKRYFGLFAAVLLPFELLGDTAQPRALDLKELKLPPGFEISIYARGLGQARMMAFSPSGNLFVSDLNGHRILMIAGPGRVFIFATGVNLPHGLAFRGNDLYLAENQRIIAYRNVSNASPTAGTPDVIAPLPTGTLGHVTRTILFDNDGKLILTDGSTCNICNETDPRRAAALRFNADGSGMEIFARGLRNTVGLALHPVTGEIWGTDNGADGLGDDVPPDEINIIRGGKDYGWPRCYGDGSLYPGFSGDCSTTERPELKLQAHSAPLGISFYTGSMFPARYRNDAFVAFHGSWNRTQPTGYKLVRILASSGRAQGVEDFLTGFLSGNTTSGRPMYALTGPDGALYISDDMNGVVYRVTYTGPRLEPEGLVSAAARISSVAPGALVSLYGGNFADAPLGVSSLPLPSSLKDVSVTVNGVKAPLLYAGPQQINFQIPFGVEGPVEIAVSNARATDSVQAVVRAIAPAIFTADQSGVGLAAYTQSGEAVSIFCTGLGEVSPPVAAGAAAPRNPLSIAINPVKVLIDGADAQVTFAGLAPDYAGLYQVNAIIPPPAARGKRVSLVVSAAGVASNPTEVVLQ